MWTGCTRSFGTASCIKSTCTNACLHVFSHRGGHTCVREASTPGKQRPGLQCRPAWVQHFPLPLRLFNSFQLFDNVVAREVIGLQMSNKIVLLFRASMVSRSEGDFTKASGTKGHHTRRCSGCTHTQVYLWARPQPIPSSVFGCSIK